ncbi:C40 family peptidase [Streptomyces sp. NPDC058291]|uniref:C40 family peptidase n=1 Tax=Streptomyces sp. NPDC058291 TaxID=3346427 RepID=UPI0036EAE8C0
MASQHRKPRSASPRAAGIRPPAFATAALTSVALLSQTANAAPSEDGRPSLEEVEKKVDDLYRQAESATEKYDVAKEKTARQRKRVDSRSDDVLQRAQRAPQLDQPREEPGSRTAARYRAGAPAPSAPAPAPSAPAPPTATFRLADAPQDYFDQNQVVSQVAEQSATAGTRREAAEGHAPFTDAQSGLRTAKATVQKKLGDARELLSRLTDQEKARLAAIEQRQREEAARDAAEFTLRQAAVPASARQESGGPSSTGTASYSPSVALRQAAVPASARQESGGPSSTGTASYSPSVALSPTEPSYGAKADKALAFARAQIGKPCVWGAMGPGSYDCSGLTQAAWKAAGVTLPRTAHDQATAGAPVALADARPGDLVFFHADASHVGVYLGNGMMIHAPKPGAYVREEPVHHHDGGSGIHSVVRPA